MAVGAGGSDAAGGAELTASRRPRAAALMVASARRVRRGSARGSSLPALLMLLLKCFGSTLTTLLNLTMFAMYKPKLEPFDTEEVFPLSFRGLSKCLLISVL